MGDSNQVLAYERDKKVLRTNADTSPTLKDAILRGGHPEYGGFQFSILTRDGREVPYSQFTPPSQPTTVQLRARFTTEICGTPADRGAPEDIVWQRRRQAPAWKDHLVQGLQYLGIHAEEREIRES